MLNRALCCAIVVAALTSPCRSGHAAGSTADDPPTFTTWINSAISATPAELHETIVQMHADAEVAIEKYELAVKNGKIKSLKLLAVGETVFETERTEHLSKLLADWGEPAGYDMGFRANGLRIRVNAVRDELVQRSSEPIRLAYPQLEARAKKFRKLADQAEKLRDEGKVLEAEKRLLPVYRELAAMACWYDGEQRRHPMEKFDRMYSSICDRIVIKNRDEALECLNGLLAKLRPKLDQWPSKLSAATVSPEGKVEWNSKQLSGPEAVVEIVAAWEQLQTQFQRALAVQIAIGKKDRADGPWESLLANDRDSYAAMIEKLVSILEADAARVDEADCDELLLSYLASVGSVTDQLDSDAQSTLAASLEKLSKRSAATAAQVATYQLATDDLLRWRSRSADSAYHGRLSAKMNRTIENSNTLPSHVDQTVPELQAAVMRELADKPLTAKGSLCHLTGGSSIGSAQIGPVILRTECPLPPVAESLATELLVSDDTPPATLAASRALNSARLGRYTAIGGTVSSIEPVGIASLLVGKRPERSAAFALTADPSLKWAKNAQPPAIRLLVTVTPDWIGGEHFWAAIGPVNGHVKQVSATE